MLTPTNYFEWSMLMQINMEANLMWDAVEGNPTSVPNDKAALAAMPVVRFKAEARGDGSEVREECAVCLGSFDAAADELLRVLPKCRHAFHAGCVDRWLHQHATCPLCRTAVIVAGAPQQRPAELPV